MHRLVIAPFVTALMLTACAGNAGNLEAFCDAAGEAAEAARDIDTSASPEDLRVAYEAMDVHIQEMAKTAPNEVATDMRALDAAWDANLEALDDVDFVLEDLPEPEDPEEGDEFDTAAGAVERFVADECEDVEFDVGPR